MGQTVAQLKSFRADDRDHGRRTEKRRCFALGARMIGACVLLLLLMLTGMVSVQAGGLASPMSTKGTQGGNGTPVEITPEQSPTVVETTPSAVWDETVLSELADRLGWPSVVVVDGTGKYVIELDITSNEWAQASIRPFAYQTSAETAFSAEQEDARFSGYTVEPTTFYTYPAYSATANGANGNVVERRLRWLVDTKIMGVTLYGTSSTILAMDPGAVGRELLLTAVQNGMPEPPGGVLPTPEPTEGLPPSATATVASCGITFGDVEPQFWAYRYVMQLACEGVVSGYSDGTFRPDNATTRAQLAKMLVITNGWELLNPAEPSFEDVNRSHLFYRYVETAYAHGVFDGYGANFRPDSFVTRAQVAKMLVRSNDWPLTLGGQAAVPLCDVPQDHWSWLYVQVAMQHHVFSGYANGCFLPDAAATRAQIAKVLVLARP